MDCNCNCNIDCIVQFLADSAQPESKQDINKSTDWLLSMTHVTASNRSIYP